MKIEKVILGGGINGLLFLYYNPDFTLITDKIGGQMAHSFDLGARYLHKTEYSQKFLESLDQTTAVEKIKVGYFNKKFVKPTQDFRMAYYMKSRGLLEGKLNDKTSMNNNMNEFLALKCDFRQIVKVLQKRCKDRIKIGAVTEIMPKQHRLKLANGEIIQYDKLVSTLPMPLFAKLVGRIVDVVSKDVTYVHIKKSPIDLGKFNFVYCLKPFKFHRISQLSESYVVEFIGNWERKQLQKILIHLRIQDVFVGKNLQIIDSRSPISNNFTESMKTHDIEFIGRYAKWDRRQKVEDVIKESLEYKNASHSHRH